MKPIVKKDRTNMVIKSTRILLTYRGREYQKSISDRSSGSTTESNPKRRNPLDYKGNASRCRVCQSIFHCEKDKMLVKLLYTKLSCTRKKYYMQHFTGEAICTAILGSGASKTVFSKTWLRCFEETLPKEKQE